MNIIKENKGFTGLEYKRFVDKKELFKVHIAGYRKEYDEFIYFILNNSNGEIIEESYRFLNYELSSSSIKQRERSFTALKLLYSFKELFYLDELEDFNREYTNKLIAFLKGGDQKDHNIIYYSKTVRNNETINNYFGVYRIYFKYLGIENSVFDEAKIISSLKGGVGLLAHTQKMIRTKYLVSRNVCEREEVPSYISFVEYEKIMEIVKEKYSLREEIIIKLMYEYGLRIGEVIGLTIEDIIDSLDSKSGYNEVELRNRYTDKPYQHCKGCMTVNSRDIYNTPEYFKKGCRRAGYQVVQITSNTKNLINEYVNDTILNPFISSKLKSNLETKNNADLVKKDSKLEKNHYIFISKNFSPISITAWNRILKCIYEEAGINLDKINKENGLNHKCRHGFAMFKVLVEDYDQLRLKNALRHSNLNSCSTYFKPTEADYVKFIDIRKRLLGKGGLSRI